MIVRSVAVIAVVAACGSPPSDVKQARAAAEAALAEPPPYEGVTRCGPPAPTPQPTPPTPTFGFTGAGDADADIDTHGYLDKDLIARPIRARSELYRACFTKLLAVSPDDTGGRVTARFQVLADGSVAGLEVEGWNPMLDACMCDVLLRVQFPKFGSAKLFGGVTVSYPFIFNAGR